MPVIIEGLLTTLNLDGSVNLAPLGPIVEGEFECFILRPFTTSTSYQNLKRTHRGVFHITDDAALIAAAAIGRAKPQPPLHPTPSGAGQILSDACRWYELSVESIDDSAARSEMTTRIVAQGTLREFFGFNRARHAVIEAAILATRLHLLAASDILAEYARLQTAIDKTGGPAELAALDLLRAYVSAQQNTPAG